MNKVDIFLVLTKFTRYTLSASPVRIVEVYALPTGTFVLASMEDNKICRLVYTF